MCDVKVIAVWSTLFACKGYVPVDSETKLPRLRRLFAETKPVACIGEVGAVAIAQAASEFQVPLLTFNQGALAGLEIAQTSSYASVDIVHDGHGFSSDQKAYPRTLDLSLPHPKTSQLCILLFSSGSTGTPKGIVYNHRWLMGGSWYVHVFYQSFCLKWSLLQYIRNTSPCSNQRFVGKDLELDQYSRCLLRCSYVWSVSVYDLFPVNMMGGTLFIPPKGGHLNVQYVGKYIFKLNLKPI